jgi:hypothetical protein
MIARHSGPARAVPSPTGEQSGLRAVAMPTEHGGWSLTLEPVLLGLLVAWSWPGVALGLAAMLAFLARTPVKLVLVDRWRGRWHMRTTVAARVAGVELLVLLALVVPQRSEPTDGSGGRCSSLRRSWRSSCGSTCAAAADGFSPNSPDPSASARSPLRSPLPTAPRPPWLSDSG